MATYAHPLVGDDDLAEMTGQRSPSAHRRWLDDNGVRYFLDRNGHPRTTWGAVDAVLVGNTTASQTGINWGAVR